MSTEAPPLAGFDLDNSPVHLQKRTDLAGRTLVRVYSDENPGAGFESVEADLQDVYFSTMSGHIGRRGGQHAG